MTGPGGWEIGAISYQRSNFSGGWTVANAVAADGYHLAIRGGVSVVNGSGPIPTAHAQPEFWDGVAWATWGEFRKNLDPGHPIEGGGVVPPEFVFWEWIFANPGTVTRTRLRIEWVDGLHYSAEIALTTFLLVEGELSPFLQDSEFGVVARIGSFAYRGIFQDPHAIQFDIEGVAPVLAVEAALVDPAQGETVSIDGRPESWIVRGRAKRVSGLLWLKLEEAA